MSGLLLFEGAGVQIAFKESDSLISNPIEASGDTLNQPELGQQRESITGVRLRCYIQLIESKRCEIPLMLDCLEDAFVDGIHPLSTLSHIFGVLRVAHRCADGLSDGAYSFIDSAIQASRNAQ